MQKAKLSPFCRLYYIFPLTLPPLIQQDIHFFHIVMKNTLLLTSLGCMAAAGAYGQATAERPNVILLVADDLGYGDLSCYGAEAERVSTPRVDSIARGGVRFTDAHAVASTSTPSRYSLLTGEYCFRRPDTNIAAGDAAMIIKPDQVTIKRKRSKKR